eukprot:TRINITY_DN240_c0_g1_i4.p1 TRINITY_DN240_c0_g1~~TRINITY_DN240_c0_g1_i4.p1  ORF type:complete len:123 (-),score=21.48 TRINITY_DN240_c0_g1_i4:194-562(-)
MRQGIEACDGGNEKPPSPARPGTKASCLHALSPQLLLLVITYVITTHWTRLRYVWKVLRRHQLPNRLRDFARDAYLVYADTDRDVIWACQTLPPLLRQHRPLRLLLRNAEDMAGEPMAENIV